MKNVLIPAVLAIALSCPAAATAQISDHSKTTVRPAQPDQALFISPSDVSAKVSVLQDGVAVSTLPTGPDALVLLSRRDVDGEIEVHSARHDEIIVREGSATILVGGHVTGAHEISGGEYRGGVLTGSTSYKLTPGSLIWIPAGLPHQILVQNGASFTYLAVKFNASTPVESHK